MKNKKKIIVVGAGYVGTAVAIALSSYNEVILYDLDKEKVRLLNIGETAFLDNDVQKFFRNLEGKRLVITSSEENIFTNAEYAVIAVSTDWDNNEEHLSIVNLCAVLDKIQSCNKKIGVIIKSTLPLGTMKYLSENYSFMKILYVPEFLREGNAVYDETHISRLIIGADNSSILYAEQVKKLFLEAQANDNVPVIYMSGQEAELVKLASNSYLAMRVAFFNELDIYIESEDLDSRKVITGISLDPRIGNYYNCPSFGYGGYCLPKDTKELVHAFDNLHVSLIPAVVASNQLRKEYIAKQIINTLEARKISNPIIGIYRVNMKRNSDNCRNAAILDIVGFLLKKGYTVIVYEPLGNVELDLAVKVENNLNEFKRTSDLIVANRISEELEDISDKLFTRDFLDEKNTNDLWH